MQTRLVFFQARPGTLCRNETGSHQSAARRPEYASAASRHFARYINDMNMMGSEEEKKDRPGVALCSHLTWQLSSDIFLCIDLIICSSSRRYLLTIKNSIFGHFTSSQPHSRTSAVLCWSGIHQHAVLGLTAFGWTGIIVACLIPYRSRYDTLGCIFVSRADRRVLFVCPLHALAI